MITFAIQRENYELVIRAEFRGKGVEAELTPFVDDYNLRRLAHERDVLIKGRRYEKNNTP